MKALVLNAVVVGSISRTWTSPRRLGAKFWSMCERPGCVTLTCSSPRTLSSDTGRVWPRDLGIVAEIEARCRGIRVGIHVVGSLAQWCGSCPRCQSGRSFQCNTRRRHYGGRPMRRG